MTLKCIDVGFFFIVIFFSVVHNFKHHTQQTNQGPVFSEIQKNISHVNHLLKDLLQKYSQLKQIAKADKENTDQKTNKNVDDFFKGDSKIKVSAKFQLAKPPESVVKTLFKNDKILERKDSEENKNKKQKPKESNDDDDNLSRPDLLDSQDDKSITTMFRSLLTQNQRHGENAKKKKVSDETGYSSEVVRGNPKEVKDPQDEEKVLVIHLGGTTKPKIKENRATSQKKTLILSTHNKTQTTKSIVFKAGTTRHHDSDLEEEIAMQKEILRVKQLRNAFSNACSQVVVRKCQNALKAVLKDVCRSGRKCSDTFNNDFANNGVAACNKQFKQTVKKRGRLVDQYSGDDEYVDTNNQEISELTGAQFIDYTREGYLDMTCLQALSKIKEPIERMNSAKIDAKAREVLNLRDRYEKACKQASYDKCMTACKSTTDQTCKKYDCVTEKIKALKQSCKRRCKESNAFEGGGSGDSSDSSDSESGSDDDSD